MTETLAKAPSLLTGAEAAQYLRISPKTLEAWRMHGGGPPFVRLRGRTIRYRSEDLRQFIGDSLRLSTSDPGLGASGTAPVKGGEDEHL